MLELDLSVVKAILRRHPNAGALQHLVPTISSFLGPSPHLTFHRACDFSSVVLLDWIWNSSCTSVDTRPSEANFLRSDPHYHHWEFSISVEMAAGRGDLEIIKWLFTHFSDCQVPVEAVEAAASNGQLAVLQYLLDHDINNQENAQINNKKKRKVVTESGELVSVEDSAESAIATQTVCWDVTLRYRTSLAQLAVENGHSETARWLYDNIPTERGRFGAIEAALKRNDMALARSFVPQGQDIFDMMYGIYRTGNVEMIEHILDSGFLRTRSFNGPMIIKELVGSGRLDLMQRVASLRYSPHRNHTKWAKMWRDVLKSVCIRGDCAMVQWALKHPMGRQACKLLKQDNQVSELLANAVTGGRGIDVLQSLKDSGSVDKYGPALMEAVAKNDMKSIKWLVANFPQSERISDYCVLGEAAGRGHLDLLKYFQSLPSVPGFVPDTAQIQHDQRGGKSRLFSTGPPMRVPTRDRFRKLENNQHWQRSSWNSTDAMDTTAANGHLETVQWLHANRTEGCTTDAMDCAAANGHLEIVQWLHANQTEGCTTNAMDFAAGNGHLDVVKWLQANRSEGLTTIAMNEAASRGNLRMMKWLHQHTSAGCTSDAMDWAAGNGHLSVVVWLHANKTEECTDSAVKMSLRYRHLAVASWLRRTYPEVMPQYVDLSCFSRKRYEIPSAAPALHWGPPAPRTDHLEFPRSISILTTGYGVVAVLPLPLALQISLLRISSDRTLITIAGSSLSQWKWLQNMEIWR